MENKKPQSEDQGQMCKAEDITFLYPRHIDRVAKDVAWFRERPGLRYRLRRSVAGEFPGEPYGISHSYSLIQWDPFLCVLDRWLLEGGEIGRECETMAPVMTPHDYDVLLGHLWRVVSDAAKIRWRCDKLPQDWLRAYQRERGLL